MPALPDRAAAALPSGPSNPSSRAPLNLRELQRSPTRMDRTATHQIAAYIRGVSQSHMSAKGFGRPAISHPDRRHRPRMPALPDRAAAALPSGPSNPSSRAPLNLRELQRSPTRMDRTATHQIAAYIRGVSQSHMSAKGFGRPAISHPDRRHRPRMPAPARPRRRGFAIRPVKPVIPGAAQPA